MNGSLWNIAATSNDASPVHRNSGGGGAVLGRRRSSFLQSLTITLHSEPPTVQAQYLVGSILSNDPFKVEDVLVETNLCPNFSIGWGTNVNNNNNNNNIHGNKSTSTSPRSWILSTSQVQSDDSKRNTKVSSPSNAKRYSMDQIFQLKHVLGENPTPLQLSILQVYYQAIRCFSNTLILYVNRRKDLSRAIKICQLLIDHGADIGRTSSYYLHNQNNNNNSRATSSNTSNLTKKIYEEEDMQDREDHEVPIDDCDHCFFQGSQELSALDWAFGLRQLAIEQSNEMVEHAIQIILDGLLQKLYDNEDAYRRLQLANHKNTDEHNRSFGGIDDEGCWGQDIIVNGGDDDGFDRPIEKPRSELAMQYQGVTNSSTGDGSLSRTESRDDYDGENNFGDDQEFEIDRDNGIANEIESRLNHDYNLDQNGISATPETNDEIEYSLDLRDDIGTMRPSFATTQPPFLFNQDSMEVIDSVTSFLFGGGGSDWKRNDKYVEGASPVLQWTSVKSEVDLLMFVIPIEDSRTENEGKDDGLAGHAKVGSEDHLPRQNEPMYSGKPDNLESSFTNESKTASIVRV